MKKRMSVQNIKRALNVVRLFKWFAVIYVGAFCVNSFAYHLSYNSPVMDVVRLLLISVSTFIFAYGLINLISHIQKGGLSFVVEVIKGFINGK